MKNKSKAPAASMESVGMSFEKSNALLERSLRVIPSATQTFSKGYTQFPVGASPLFIERGEGAYVWDVDGNRYIDYILGLGPSILGHGHPAVVAAVSEQVRKGAGHSLATPLEVEVAEMLVERIPCAEMVRFGKNGSDVTSGAVRLARAITGRDRIACCGYHGWHDWYIGTTTRSRGVPDAVRGLTSTFEYNNLDSLKRLFEEFPGQIAAVIMEPVGAEEPKPGFLQGVADLARKNGAVFVFDEVVTGFRLARGGAQEFYGVVPDLACFGKAMGGGLPISALVGRRELMKVCDDIFFSFTAGGEAVSLAACKAVLGVLDGRDVYREIWSKGQLLKDSVNRLAERRGISAQVRCIGPSPKSVIEFRDKGSESSLELRSLFQQEVAARGVLFLTGHSICTALSQDDIQKTVAAYDETLEIMSRALETGAAKSLLRGEVAKPVFRKP